MLFPGEYKTLVFLLISLEICLYQYNQRYPATYGTSVQSELSLDGTWNAHIPVSENSKTFHKLMQFI